MPMRLLLAAQQRFGGRIAGLECIAGINLIAIPAFADFILPLQHQQIIGLAGV